MIVIKKSHDDIGETGDIANIANFASANFYSVCCPAYHAASDFVFFASESYSDISILVSRVYASCMHLCTVYIARIVSDSLEIPWWFVSGYATHCLPKPYLTFIYCLIYPLPLGGGPAKNRDVNQRSVCRPKKRRARQSLNRAPGNFNFWEEEEVRQLSRYV